MRKGQTAMEYLMTYGWAILIILIVGGLLVYYGVFSIRPASTATGFSGFGVSLPWDYNTAGSLRFRVTDNIGQNVNITRVFITDPDTGTTTGVADITDVSLAPGQTSDFITATPAPAISGNSGDPYKIKVAFEYYIGTEPFNSTGTLTGTRS